MPDTGLEKHDWFPEPRPGATEKTDTAEVYVDGHLLWAWDIAALGSPLSAHASARLARAE